MDYIDKFNVRVKSYMYATRNYKDVLKEENLNAIEMINAKENEKILHLCSAGVDIKENILKNVNCELIEGDTNKEFAIEDNVYYFDLFNLPFEDNTFDKVLIVANLHHSSIDERNLIYKEINRILKQNGCFVIGDVLKGSKQDRFLNEFVDKYNPLGHFGLFFDNNDIKQLENNNFKSNCKLVNYKWNFLNKDVLNDFSYNMFYLKNIEKDKIFDEVKKYLDIVENNNMISWNWQLIYFHSYKI